MPTPDAVTASVEYQIGYIAHLLQSRGVITADEADHICRPNDRSTPPPAKEPEAHQWREDNWCARCGASRHDEPWDKSTTCPGTTQPAPTPKAEPEPPFSERAPSQEYLKKYAESVLATIANELPPMFHPDVPTVIRVRYLVEQWRSLVNPTPKAEPAPIPWPSDLSTLVGKRIRMKPRGVGFVETRITVTSINDGVYGPMVETNIAGFPISNFDLLSVEDAEPKPAPFAPLPEGEDIVKHLRVLQTLNTVYVSDFRQAADTIDTLTRQLAEERERAERWKAEAMAWRFQDEAWYGEHPEDTGTYIDKAAEACANVDRARALNDQSEPPDAGAKASSPSDRNTQQEKQP